MPGHQLWRARARWSTRSAESRGTCADGLANPETIDEQTVANCLYTCGMPDPDLLVRTAGEMRISNFLLWQISYAELWVTDKCWPEFEVADLHRALLDYAARDRRFGGLRR